LSFITVVMATLLEGDCHDIPVPRATSVREDTGMRVIETARTSGGCHPEPAERARRTLRFGPSAPESGSFAVYAAQDDRVSAAQDDGGYVAHDDRSG
jgi:hypothetical protein